MRFTWYRRYLTLRPTIKKIFWISLVSILLIELIIKDAKIPFLWISTTVGIYSKLCYSIIAAIFLYYFNVHWPNEEKKVKTLLYVSNKVHEINTESRWILDILKIQDKPLQNKTYEQISEEIQSCCDSLDEDAPFRDTNGLPYDNWYSFLRQKGELVNELINDLLVFEGLINTEVLECLIFIENDLKIYGLGTKKTRIGKSELKQYSKFIAQLYINSCHATNILREKLLTYQLEHHENYRDRPTRLAKGREKVMKKVRIEHERLIKESSISREELS